MCVSPARETTLTFFVMYLAPLFFFFLFFFFFFFFFFFLAFSPERISKPNCCALYNFFMVYISFKHLVEAYIRTSRHAACKRDDKMWPLTAFKISVSLSFLN